MNLVPFGIVIEYEIQILATISQMGEALFPKSPSKRLGKHFQSRTQCAVVTYLNHWQIYARVSIAALLAAIIVAVLLL